MYRSSLLIFHKKVLHGWNKFYCCIHKPWSINGIPYALAKSDSFFKIGEKKMFLSSSLKFSTSSDCSSTVLQSPNTYLLIAPLSFSISCSGWGISNGSILANFSTNWILLWWFPLINGTLILSWCYSMGVKCFPKKGLTSNDPIWIKNICWLNIIL